MWFHRISAGEDLPGFALELIIMIVLVAATSTVQIAGCGGGGEGDEEPCSAFVECLKEHQQSSYTSQELASLDAEIEHCLGCDTTAWIPCLPIQMGRFDLNDMDLVLGATCADLCPTYTYAFIMYPNVEESDCQDIGGVELRSPGWNGYVGCAPSESAMIWRYTDECD